MQYKCIIMLLGGKNGRERRKIVSRIFQTPYIKAQKRRRVASNSEKRDGRWDGEKQLLRSQSEKDVWLGYSIASIEFMEYIVSSTYYFILGIHTNEILLLRNEYTFECCWTVFKWAYVALPCYRLILYMYTMVCWVTKIINRYNERFLRKLVFYTSCFL